MKVWVLDELFGQTKLDLSFVREGEILVPFK
jgi:hypothetical protein